MQLMPQIARHYGVNDASDPISSIWGAAAHLAHMIEVATELLKYTRDYNIEKVALTMYNLGETAYREAVRGKREMPRESLEYPDKVMAAAGSRLKYHCNNQNLV
jgi:membrane-bound lytic murein transglycosylase MltF